MKVSKNCPQWAHDLTVKVCEDNTRQLPGELKWSWTGSLSAGGTCYNHRTKKGDQVYKYNYRTKRYGKFQGKIAIRAGKYSSEPRQKIVLLHELAHWVCNRKYGQGHTVRFWKIAWKFYHQYGADIDRAIKEEGRYKQFAMVVYDREYRK